MSSIKSQLQCNIKTNHPSVANFWCRILEINVLQGTFETDVSLLTCPANDTYSYTPSGDQPMKEQEMKIHGVH